MGALDGKVALITGAASGIGKATAERFAAEGARVAVVDFSDDDGRAVAEAVGGRFIHADAGNAGEVDAAFAECERELGGLDVAFLNAGIAIGHADLETLTDELYRKIMHVNVDGVVFGTRAAIRSLDRHDGGAIVATASVAGIIPFPADPIYDATKHYVVGLIRSLAPTLAARNIRANTVNPGITDTNIIGDDVKAAFAKADFPIMPASQIADAVFRLATSDVTGQCWVCQPGRDAEPYAFHQVPGPRTESARGRVPPSVSMT